jgi:Protein of unknown function, DUF488
MFEDSLARCIELATRERVVLMCAEAVPWRCHRSLIADALIVRRIDAGEITSGIRTRPHALTPWALVNGTHVTYPSERAESDPISHEGAVAPLMGGTLRREVNRRPRG